MSLQAAAVAHSPSTPNAGWHLSPLAPLTRALATCCFPVPATQPSEAKHFLHFRSLCSSHWGRPGCSPRIPRPGWPCPAGPAATVRGGRTEENPGL